MFSGEGETAETVACHTESVAPLKIASVCLNYCLRVSQREFSRPGERKRWVICHHCMCHQLAFANDANEVFGVSFGGQDRLLRPPRKHQIWSRGQITLLSEVLLRLKADYYIFIAENVLNNMNGKEILLHLSYGCCQTGSEMTNSNTSHLKWIVLKIPALNS